MKLFASCVVAACLFSGGAQAQNCISQYASAPGMSPNSLVLDGYDIKAGWAGGLWLQKGTSAYFCNSGAAKDEDAICWKLRKPLAGQSCQ